MVRKPYIKKFCEISNFKVWIVDGKYIRQHIDEEFTNFGQHYRFKFIPKNEFWLDKQFGDPEEKHYIDHLLVEHSLMKKGVSYNKALEKANEVEKRERSKSKLYKRLEKIKERKSHLLLKRIHKKLLRSYSKHLKIWVVRGNLVRDLFFIDFTQGGHDKVYPFIPKDEIWIDDDISQKERRFILLHEAHERFLMANGWTYDHAHISSSEIELYMRKNPAHLNERLKKELKNNNELIKHEKEISSIHHKHQ